MPAWPGGPCPKCGIDMPPRVIHCQNCRYLLNDELEDDTVTEPVFFPLQEIDETSVVAPRGVHENCHACGKELKISRRFLGQMVSCKHCQAAFPVASDLQPLSGRNAYYLDCPHCDKSLRVSTKYLGQRVCCKFCQGELQIELEDHRQPQ